MDEDTTSRNFVDFVVTDYDQTSTLTYTLLQTDSFFTMDGGTPNRLRLNSVIDLDVCNALLHYMTVEADDGGDPTAPVRTGTATVTVTINRLNNHTPIWAPWTPSTSISENTPAGTSIHRLVATDADCYAEGDFVFKLVSAETSKSKIIYK